MGISGEELNYLIYRYLLECGYTSTANMFGYEAQTPAPSLPQVDLPSGALVMLARKGALLLGIESHVGPDGGLRRCSGEFPLFGQHKCVTDSLPTPPSPSDSLPEFQRTDIKFVLCSSVRIPPPRELPAPKLEAPPLLSAPILKVFPLRGKGVGSRFFLALNTMGFGAVVDPLGQLCLPIYANMNNPLSVVAACVHPTMPFVSLVTSQGHVFQHCCLPTVAALLRSQTAATQPSDLVVPPSSLSQFRINRVPDGTVFSNIIYNSTGSALYLGGNGSPNPTTEAGLSLYWFSSASYSGTRPQIMRLPIQYWQKLRAMLPCPNPQMDDVLLALGQGGDPDGTPTSRATIICTVAPRVHALFHQLHDYHDEDADLNCGAWAADGSLIALGDNRGAVSVWCRRSVPAMYEISIQRLCRQLQAGTSHPHSMQDLLNYFKQKMRHQIIAQGEQNPEDTELYHQFCHDQNTSFVVPVAHFRADGPIRHIALTRCSGSDDRYLVAYSTYSTTASLTVRSVRVTVPQQLQSEAIYTNIVSYWHHRAVPSYDDTNPAQSVGSDGTGTVLLLTRHPLSPPSEPDPSVGPSVPAIDDTLSGSLATAAARFEKLHARWSREPHHVTAVPFSAADLHVPMAAEGPWIVALHWAGTVLVAVTRDGLAKFYAQDVAAYDKMTQATQEPLDITPEIFSMIRSGQSHAQPLVCTGPAPTPSLELPKPAEPFQLVSVRRLHGDQARCTCQPEDAKTIAQLLNIANPTIEKVSEACASPAGFISSAAIHTCPLTLAAGDAAGGVEIWRAPTIQDK